MAFTAPRLIGFQDSGSYSPADVERRRKLAEALMGSEFQAKDPLGALAKTLSGALGGYEMSRTNEAETAGKSAAAEKLGALLSNPNATMADFGSVISDPWAGDAQLRMAQLLMGEQLANNRQQAAWDRDDRLRAEELARPDWQTFDVGGDIYRYNQNDPNSTPSLFFDGPEAAPEAPSVKTIFDPATGRELTVQWTGDGEFGGWSPVGGVQAPKDPLVQVNTGDNSSAFGKKADETAATRMSDIVTAGQDASRFMGDMETLAALGPQIGTGKGAEILSTLGPYGQALGFDIEGLDEAQAYQAIVDRMAPAMRPAGSGASSDFDARQFLSSLPSLGRTPEGNQIIIETLSAMQQHKIAAAEIASKALSNEITWPEADRQIAALGDPYNAFNEYKKRAGEGQKQDGASGASEVIDYTEYFN